MEGLMGATLGKMMFGTKVVKEDGSACDFKASLIRNILRYVDYFLLGLVGIISVKKSEMKQRVGDKVAHTIVVKR